MRKQRFFFILLFLAALAALMWYVFHERSEPSYKGKSLHQWLAFYSQSNGGYDPAVDEAVRHIGTNAIPTLLEMLRAQDSHLKSKWIALMQIQHIFKPPPQASVRSFEAMRGFNALGQTAVPALLQTYRAKISDSSQWTILGALGVMGPTVLPAATPVLLDGLIDSNAGVRSSAAMAIGQIHGQPEVFVPALINALKDSSPLVRQWTIIALVEYGPAAKSAAPAIMPFLNDTDPDVRSVAVAALKKIDPEAAANAGIK